MKTSNIIFVALAATAFAACSQDRTLEYEAPEIHVSADVEANTVVTRAIDNGTTATSGSKYTTAEFQNSGNFLQNTDLAVYVEEVDPTTGNKVTSSNMNYATPAQYTNSDASALNKFTTAAPQSFPTSGKNVKVYAFYPYSEFSSITDRASETAHQFTVSNDQTSITNYRSSDLMASSIVGTGTPAPGIRNTTASLTFNHLLSKVTVIVKRNSGITAAQLGGAVVWIKNTNTSASLNMNEMKLNETGTSTNNFTHASGSVNSIKVMELATTDLPNSIDVTSPDTPSEITASAIVVPQPIGTTDPFITVALSSANGSGEFKYTPGTAFNLVGGNEYIYTITIKNEGIEVEGVITAWSSNTGSGDATL